jgi:hypothetical protein
MKLTLWMATDSDNITTLHSDSDNITTLHSGKPKRKPCGWAYGGKTLLILGKNIDGQTWEDDPKQIEVDTDGNK